MQKRTLYSLLLISFILVFAYSLSVAQTVTFETASVTRCVATPLSVTVNNPSAVSAIEIVFEVRSTGGGAYFDVMNVTWASGFSNLTNRIMDLSGVDLVSPDTVRMAAMLTSATDACLPIGQKVVATINVTTENVCSGQITFDGAVFSCPSFDVSTQFVDCATTSLVAAAVTPGVVTVQNHPPVITAIPDVTLHWGATYTATATATDPDAGPCESKTFSKISGPSAMTVNASTGAISWHTTGADVCEHEVEIGVTDACGATASTVFTICVQNTPPVVSCPADTLIALGDDLTANLTGSDPDLGPSGLLYTLIGWTGPGTPTLSPTGQFYWSTLLEEQYKGTFTATVTVSDGAAVCAGCSPANADTCSFDITVVNFVMTLETTGEVPPGQSVTMNVVMQNSAFENYPMGGFDFLLQYDASALAFQLAEPGQFLEDCDWEYFTYRYGPSGNCGGNACPSGILRVTAIAETVDGPNHPTCFTNGDPAISNELFTLQFLVTSDPNLRCQFVPVRYIWYDCGDNSISSVDGNQLFISNHVYNMDSTSAYAIDIADPTADFPSLFGANSTCDVAVDDGYPDLLRFVDFVNGGVMIGCPSGMNERGDINLNQVSYEIADAVLFSNYFIYGIGVFTIDQPLQIASTDVNADGLTLSVADLVYLIRIITGDAMPYPKEVTPGQTDFIHADNGVLAIKSDLPMGAAFVVISGDQTPTLKADQMEMKFAYDGANTRILVYSLDGNTFSGEFLSVQGDIVSIELADFEGNPVAAKWIPASFAMKQNYPNPFNPTTTISFDLPVNAEYELTIYNVNGQKVTSFTGTHEAGIVNIDWDASNNASGIYFYRLTAGSFSDTKKMVLLK